MGPPQRVRYNARARGGVGSSHKKKKIKKSSQQEVDQCGLPNTQVQVADPNLQILEVRSKEQKEQDDRERIRQALLASTESRMTSKKRKRMESYIDKKLKKEERLQIFERLSRTQAEIDSLNLKTSSTLGSAKVLTHGERMELDGHRLVRRYTQGSRRRKETGHQAEPSSGESEESEWGGINDKMDTRSTFTFPGDIRPTSRSTSLDREVQSTVIVHEHNVANRQPSVIGSALQRNPDGTVVAPRVVKRKPKTRHGRMARLNPPFSSKELDDNAFEASSSIFDPDEEGAQGDEDVQSSSGTSGSESEASSETSDGPETSQTKRPRFKEWARKQIDAAKGYDPPNPPPTEILPTLPPHFRPAKPVVDSNEGVTKIGPLGEVLSVPKTSLAQQVQSGEMTLKRHVVVTRSDGVRESRILLPIISEEQAIVEAILLNPVVIICGETGSGKTTQVPQFLYEAGFGSPGSDNPGMIGITQPRRVAAMSMAARVAHELSLPSSRVSYQIRYDATVSPTTSIKFMTDGVLLRELTTDFLLLKYSVIIVDEAHERSMNTDILIGVLSRVMKLREDLWIQKKDGVKPLRLIIMSATLRVGDFAENKALFPTTPPIINVDARQHPVTTHFNRHTTNDYVSEAIKKAVKIHTRLPAGGILIFLTGQNEIQGVCRKLEKRFGEKVLATKRRRHRESLPKDEQGEEDDAENNVSSGNRGNARQGPVEVEEFDTEVVQEIDVKIDEGGVQDDLEALDSEDSEDDDVQINLDDSDVPMHIVPLYSLLPSDKQMKVFQPPPAGSRLVVVATNVAETSLTIPGIRYIVDTGRAKERQYDYQSGIETFRVSWISKASAAQRTGRAGRTGPGHCYRLYSSAFFENNFQEFADPEILRVPIEGLVLQMKSMHIDAVVNFPFPTPPNRDALAKAEKVLTRLGALESSPTIPPQNKSKTIQITDLGRAMAHFPVAPRFSKMLVTGQQHGCLPYVIAIVAAMSVGDPFLREEALGIDDNAGPDEPSDGENSQFNNIHTDDARNKEERRTVRRAFFKSQELHSSLGNHSSDSFRMLSVVGAFEYAGGGSGFCADHFVRLKAMEEIHKLRAQITHITEANFSGIHLESSVKLPPPSPTQLKLLRQLITSAFIDHVAVRKDLIEKSSSSGTRFSSCRGIPYQAIGISEDAFIHPSSVLFQHSPPDWIVYQEVVQGGKVWLKVVTSINPAWLSTLGRSMCTFSKPRDLPASAKKAGNELTAVTPHFGPHGWELPPLKL